MKTGTTQRKKVRFYRKSPAPTDVGKSLDEDVLLAKLSALNEKEALMQQEKRNLELSLKMQKGKAGGAHAAGAHGYTESSPYDDATNINYHATNIYQHQQNIVCNYGDNIQQNITEPGGTDSRKKKDSKKKKAKGSPCPIFSHDGDAYHDSDGCNYQDGDDPILLPISAELPVGKSYPPPVQELPVDDGECQFFDIADTPRTRMMRNSEDPIGNWFDRMESPTHEKPQSPKIVNFLNPASVYSARAKFPNAGGTTYGGRGAATSSSSSQKCEGPLHDSPSEGTSPGTPPPMKGIVNYKGTPPPANLNSFHGEGDSESDCSSQCTEVSMHVLELDEPSDDDFNNDEPGCRSGRTSSAASLVSLGSLYACDTPKSMGSLYGGSEGEEEDDTSVEEGVEKNGGSSSGSKKPEHVAVLNMCNLAAHNAGLNAKQGDHMKDRTFLPKSVLKQQHADLKGETITSMPVVETSTSMPVSNSSTTVADDTGSSAECDGAVGFAPAPALSPEQANSTKIQCSETPVALREVSVQEGAVLSPHDNDVLYVIKQI